MQNTIELALREGRADAYRKDMPDFDPGVCYVGPNARPRIWNPHTNKEHRVYLRTLYRFFVLGDARPSMPAQTCVKGCMNPHHGVLIEKLPAKAKAPRFVPPSPVPLSGSLEVRSPDGRLVGHLVLSGEAA